MTKQDYTLITAILDASGSMSNLAAETISGFNQFIDEQKALPGDAALTLAVFSSPTNYDLVYDAVPLQSITPLTKNEYSPGGYTALHDAICLTVDSVGAKLSALQEEERPSKVLVLIMTDGLENASRTFHAEDVKERITHQTEKYKLVVRIHRRKSRCHYCW